MAIHVDPEECPYRPGARLSLYNRDRNLSVTIKEILTGGVDYFNNACPVLVEVTNQHGLGSPLPKELVLKIQDWRFAYGLRTWYGCGRWNEECRQAYEKIPQSDRSNLEEFLSQKTPLTRLQHDLAEPLKLDQRLDDNTTQSDLYRLAIPDVWSTGVHLFKAGLLPVLPDEGYHEVFLRHCNSDCLEAEESMSLMVNQNIPGRMPRAYGSWKVVIEDNDQDNTKNDHSNAASGSEDAFEVHGLLMDKARGQSMNDLSGRSLTAEGVKKLFLDIQLFHIHLWSHNIQYWDFNPHNFLFDVCDTGDINFTAVDFGALTMVIPPTQTPNLNQRTFFTATAEKDLLRHLASPLSHHFPWLLRYIDELCTDYHRTDFHLTYNPGFCRMVWTTIMQSVFQSLDPHMFLEYPEAIWRALRGVRAIMEQELPSRDGGCRGEPRARWTDRVLSRIAAVVDIDHIQVRKRFEDYARVSL